MENEKKLFIFPKWEEKVKYLIIFITCSLMRRLIPRIIECFSFAKLKNQDFKINCYFDLLSNFIADFSVGIVILIKKLKKKRSNLRNSFTVTTQEGERTVQNMKKIFFYLLLLIAVIDIIAQFCLFIFSYIDTQGTVLKNEKFIKEEDLYFVVFIDIISRYFFSKFFLKGHFYPHHIFAILITCAGFIPFIVINIISIIRGYNQGNNTQERNIIIYLGLYIFMTILYSLEDVINKICLNKLIIKPYELMFYKAVFQIAFVVSLSLYMILKENLFEFITTNITGLTILGRILYRFSFIISNIFRTWSLITIIQLVSPNHLSVLKSSEFAILFIILPIFKFIKSIFDDSSAFNLDTYNVSFGIACCIISIIGSAIHNEIIIINKWGLYECTDYYKSEVKASNNNMEDFLGTESKNDENDSLFGESVSQDAAG